MEWLNYITLFQSSHFRYSLVNNKMRKKSQLALAIIITICACSSCNTERYIYTPSIPNNPYFRERESQNSQLTIHQAEMIIPGRGIRIMDLTCREPMHLVKTGL